MKKQSRFAGAFGKHALQIQLLQKLDNLAQIIQKILKELQLFCIKAAKLKIQQRKT